MEQNLEKDINAIKNNLSAFGMKLEMVYAALVGNEIAKDGGMVADIANQKRKINTLSERTDNAIEILTERIQKVEQREGKRQLYVKIIYASVVGIIVFIITHIFKL